MTSTHFSAAMAEQHRAELEGRARRRRLAREAAVATDRPAGPAAPSRFRWFGRVAVPTNVTDLSTGNPC